MARTQRTIVARTYTYKKNNNGKTVRVGAPKVKTCKQRSWGKLRSDLIQASSNKKGRNVKLKKYRTIKVATAPRIDHYYENKGNGTFTRTYYSSKKR